MRMLCVPGCVPGCVLPPASDPSFLPSSLPPSLPLPRTHVRSPPISLPACAHPWMKASMTGMRMRASETASGPPSPCSSRLPPCGGEGMQSPG